MSTKHLVPELFGPVASDTFRRWCEGGAPDHRGRPPVDLPPFALSRRANLTHAVAARLILSVPTWQHVHRRVLRELDIEFELIKGLDAAVSSELAALMETRGDSHPPQAERCKLLQLLVIYLCDRFGILTGSHLEPGRDSCAHRSSRRARVDQKKPRQPMSSPRAPSSWSRLLRT